MRPRRNWDRAARTIWDVLVARAPSAQPFVYEDVALSIKTTPINVGRALGPIQTYCMIEGLPPLTVLIVSKTTGLPGHGFVGWDGDPGEAQRRVALFDWSAIVNPFSRLGPNDSAESLATKTLEGPDEAEAVYRKVQDRGIAQRIFRQALLEAYDWQCAFCGFSFEQALEAAHIWPWSRCEPKERINPANGLLLCANHHRLFDTGRMAPTVDNRVQYRDADDEGSGYSKADRAGSLGLHGKSIKLPKLIRHRPDAALVARRRALDKWK